MAQTRLSLREFLQRVGERAESAGVFEGVNVTAQRLECGARGAAEPSFYRVDAEAGRVWVSLVMKDRWLSESVESDLMHTGDSIEELIEEEVVDLGGPRGAVPCEHYRSEDKLFTFRSPVGAEDGLDDAAVERGARLLLAYEACFRRLGDMNAAGSED